MPLSDKFMFLEAFARIFLLMLDLGRITVNKMTFYLCCQGDPSGCHDVMGMISCKQEERSLKRCKGV